MILLRLLKVYGFTFVTLFCILSSCKSRDFTVDDVATTQTFVVRKRSPLPYIDPAVTIRVTGHLDGTALVYIPNGPTQIDSFYSLNMKKGVVKKELTRAFTYKQFSVIYKPITAKSGHIEIEVVAP